MGGQGVQERGSPRVDVAREMLQQNQRRSGRRAKLAIGEADTTALDVTGGRCFQRGDVTVRGVAFSHVILRTLEDGRFHAHGGYSCCWNLLVYAANIGSICHVSSAIIRT